LQRLWRRPFALALASVLCFGGGNAARTQTAKNAGTPGLGSQGSPPQTSSAAAKFVDVTDASGVHFQGQSYHTSRKYLIETMGFGVALFDYDNDGRLDIFFANGAMLPDPTTRGTIPKKSGPKDWNRLYHQRADGTFEDVTEKAGLAGSGYDMGVAAADYDNDGYEDLYVTGYGGNHLYHNNGNGTFTDVTAASGTGGSGWSTSAAWVDLDNDGLLDLVVLRYMDWDFLDIWCGEHRDGYRAYCHPDVFMPVSALVYHNDGKGHFTEEAAKLGLANKGKGLGIALADYDRDGRVDIFVANDSMEEFLYHNKGQGTFQEDGLAAGVAVDGDGRTYAGMGVVFSDFKNNGLADLFVTDLANQKYAFYENNGDATFNYSSGSNGVGRASMLHSGWGVASLDYDNDGWDDLIVAQGHDIDNIELTLPSLHYKEPMLLLHNDGGKSFSDVTAQSGEPFQQAWVGRGLAAGDIWNDGHMDVVAATNDGPSHILRNQTTNQNHWLGVKLVGSRSNRDGIGAEIKVTTSMATQLVMASTAGSYLSSNDRRAHFGLGSDKEAKAVEVRWPSGTVQVLKDVAGDQILEIDEPVAAPK
jgi:hypothetical protein